MIKYFHQLRTHQSFQKYFANTSWLIIEKILRMVIGFFVLIAMTRYLGPEKFGLFSYSQSFVAIFISFATLGLDVILVRELTRHKEKNDTLIGTAVLLKSIASIIGIVLILFINLYIDDKESVLLTNIIAFTLLFQNFNTLDTYFQAKVISKYVVFSRSTTYFISTSIKIGLILFKAPLIFFAYALVFDAFIISIGYIYIYYLQKRSILELKYAKVTAIYFLRQGWPLMLVALSVFIYTRTDQLMINYLLGNKETGYYAAAIRVSELFYFIPLLITQSIFPKIIELKEKDNTQYFLLLEQLYKLLTWTAVPIALGLFIFSDSIISILYGTQYAPASSILSILSFTIIFNAIGTITSKVLYAERYEKKYMYRSLLGVFINIILNFYFISNYGVVGAAIATLMTLFIILYIYDIFDKDLYKFYYLKVNCFLGFKGIK